jgi:AraC family transcriptional regulator
MWPRTSPERVQASYTVIEGSAGLRFVQVDFAAEVRMALHCHEEAASLNYCLAGRLEEVREREQCVYPAATLSVMPAGVVHANRFPRGASAFLIVLEQPWLVRLSPAVELLGRPASFAGGWTSWMLGRMHHEFRRADAVTPLVLEGLLLELLAGLARHAAAQEGSSAPRWLREAVDYLHAHFREPLSPDEAAAAVGVHPAHLMRVFRRCQGCTVGEYVRRLRVEYGRRLVETTDLPLGAIALEAGFCDQGHFSRALKALTGRRPGELRASRRDARLVHPTRS